MSDLLQRLQTSLAGRYAVERELGRGGMATVFLARDEKHGRMVAIKVFSSDISVALGAERFQREIEISSSLTHPHIVPLYDSGEADGCLFYVMPFVGGESLRARLDRERQLPLDETIRIACEVAGALDYAHRNGVLHRDVKPANILLEDGHAVIADFGIARAISRAAETERMTMTGVTLGTPAYMSPEQASGEHTLDGRSDIYALACVVYEMLVGQPPFTGPNAQAVMARHAMETVPSLRIVRTTIPDEVEDAILCALSKAPADRFATAQQFADALAGGGTGITRRFTTSRAAARARQRRAKTIGMAAVAVLVAAAGAYGLYTRSNTATLYAGVGHDPRRIAVMYFEDRSRGGELGWVADALTESLIEQLQAVRGLTVLSRDAVAPYRTARASFDSIAGALETGVIIRGSVDSANGEVTVGLGLVDGNAGEEFERTSLRTPAVDLQSLPDSVAAGAALLLRERLGQEMQLRRTRAATDNPDAWSLLHRAARSRKDARALVAADSGEAAVRLLARTDSLLAVAETLDPDWLDPVLVRGELTLDRMNRVREPASPAALIDTGIAHAERALAREPRNARALELRGTLRYRKRFLGLTLDPTEAERLLREAEADLRLATEIDASRATAWNSLSLLLYRRFDIVGANQAARRAYEADSYLEAAPDIISRLYRTSYDLEQFAMAEQYCELGRRRYPASPTFIECRVWLATTTPLARDVDEAWRTVEALGASLPASTWERLRRQYEMLVAVPIARAGMADSARSVIERSRAGRDVDPRGELIGQEVLVRTLIGDKDGALDLLGPYLAAFPLHRDGFVRRETWWWRSLEDDPRYEAIVGT